MRPRFTPPRPVVTTTDRKTTGTRARYRESSGFDKEEPATTTTDEAVLEQAEREGKLLARIAAYAASEENLLTRIAEQDHELAVLRKRVTRLETALGDTLEKIALTAIHESRTSPPNAGVSAMDDRMPEDDDPESAFSQLGALVLAVPPPPPTPSPSTLVSSGSVPPSPQVTPMPVMMVGEADAAATLPPSSTRPTPVPSSS